MLRHRANPRTLSITLFKYDLQGSKISEPIVLDSADESPVHIDLVSSEEDPDGDLPPDPGVPDLSDDDLDVALDEYLKGHNRVRTLISIKKDQRIPQSISQCCINAESVIY